MPKRAALEEAFAVYALVFAAVGLVFALSFVPLVAENQQLAVGTVFLLAALELAHRDPGGPQRLGLSLGGIVSTGPGRPGVRGFLVDLLVSVRDALPSAARETRYAFGLAALVFPPFVLGYLLYHAPSSSFSLALPPAPLRFVAAQTIAVALPEEAFFRGYLMTRLTDGFGGERRVLGVTVSVPALVVQAALFALVHFAFDAQLGRLAVFFPALVFGWLRARRGGIGAAIVFHVACNVLAELLHRGFA